MKTKSITYLCAYRQWWNNDQY